MRLMFLVVALAGCASHAATSPAWPKQHVAEKDGGESLAPHTARAVAAIEKTDDEPVKPATPTAAAPAAAAPAAKDGGAAPASVPATGTVEETITTEDIVIEIDD